MSEFRFAISVNLKRMNRPVAADLASTTAASALRALIRQNYSRNLPASELFDDLISLVSQASCHDLSYHQVDEAVTSLEQQFAGPQQQPAEGA